ncbi:MAG: hypothetical protein WBW16_01680 [Bacteroidota bacterium]
MNKDQTVTIEPGSRADLAKKNVDILLELDSRIGEVYNPLSRLRTLSMAFHYSGFDDSVHFAVTREQMNDLHSVLEESIQELEKTQTRIEKQFDAAHTLNMAELRKAGFLPAE